MVFALLLHRLCSSSPWWYVYCQAKAQELHSPLECTEVAVTIISDNFSSLEVFISDLR